MPVWWGFPWAVGRAADFAALVSGPFRWRFTTALTYGVSGVLWRDGQLRGAHQSAAIFLQFFTSVAVGFGGLVWSLPDGFHLHKAAWRALEGLLVSGVLSGVFAIYCMFTALRLMAVARVYAFSSLTPLWRLCLRTSSCTNSSMG